MSMIHKGHIVESELSKNSKGGTEMMRKRVLDNVNSELLSNVAIHFSRPREIPTDVKNIMYCHDLAEDPENNILKDGGWKTFDHFVFVSQWQRDQYITYYGLPYSKCTVIPNAVEKEFSAPENMSHEGKVRFIYHTTPHRGLELLVPIFDALSKQYDNIHLDVYSGFEIYGWEQRNEAYKGLFATIEAHPNMTYHGVKSNEEVLEALDDAHIFLYPNVWKETSCIALIEAIKSQVICIHPNYGALPETAQNATIMYYWNEDPQVHANYAFSVVRQVLESMKQNENYFHGFTYSDRFNLARNSVQSFQVMWNTILRNLTNGGQR